MALVSSKEILTAARRGGYAVGSFNVFNMESAKAIIAGAEAEHAPVMLQVWGGLDSFIGLDVLGAIALCEAKKASVPVSVHLDHGESLSIVGKAIHWGFNSVMIDGSAKSLEENIALTSAVVEFAHGANIPVEGEIGHVGGEESEEYSDENIYTDPDEALYFYEKTGLDFLAVSIGTSHGRYSHRPVLNIELLKRIASKVEGPLVLHGSSYTPDDMLAEAVKNGISKINVATEMAEQVIKGTMELAKGNIVPKYVNELTDGPYMKMTELARHKIKLFGGTGKAK